MGIRALAASVVIGSFLPVGPTSGFTGADVMPRYLLSAGRELAYHNEARSERKDDERVYVVDWKIWAIGRDADGAWRLVIRCDLKTKEKTPANPPNEDRVDTLVWRCRMFDDGRLVGATTMGTVRDPFRLFPRLPASPAERERGWTSTGSERDAVSLRHRLTPGAKASGESLSITTTSEGPEDKVYDSTHESRATFDVRRGVVTRVETEDGNGYPTSGSSRGRIELVGVEDRGVDWATTFGREADRYFDAVEAYEAASKAAARDAARCKELMTEAKAKLEAAKTSVATQVFVDAVGERLTQHDATVGDLAEQANDRAARVGKAAADWESKDIDGKPHRLADYRGRVVVMDFWYRGCGWCMHAMPQVNRISRSFRDEPVAVLGMTTDADDKDARIVIDAMGLKYATIKAIGIPEKYGVQAYPTLVVIDKQGKVREIHVGYSPDLYEDLSALIHKLLAEKSVEQQTSRELETKD